MNFCLCSVAYFMRCSSPFPWALRGHNFSFVVIHARLLCRSNCLSALSESWVQTEEVGVISSSRFLKDLSQEELKNSGTLSAAQNPLLTFYWCITCEESNLPIFHQNPLTTTGVWSKKRSLSTTDKGTTQKESSGTNNAHSDKQAHYVASLEQDVHLDLWAGRGHWTFTLMMPEAESGGKTSGKYLHDLFYDLLWLQTAHKARKWSCPEGTGINLLCEESRDCSVVGLCNHSHKLSITVRWWVFSEE